MNNDYFKGTYSFNLSVREKKRQVKDYFVKKKMCSLFSEPTKGVGV